MLWWCQLAKGYHVLHYIIRMTFSSLYWGVRKKFVCIYRVYSSINKWTSILCLFWLYTHAAKHLNLWPSELYSEPYVTFLYLKCEGWACMVAFFIWAGAPLVHYRFRQQELSFEIGRFNENCKTKVLISDLVLLLERILFHLFG